MTTDSKESVTRRGYLKYAGAGIVVVAGAAAGGYYATRQPPTPTATESQTSSAETTATSAEGLVLKCLTTSDPVYYLWDRDTDITPGGLTNEYKKNTGVEVVLERIDWLSHYEKSRLELNSQSPTYDYLIYDAYVRGAYLPNNWFLDLKELESKTGVPLNENDLFTKIVNDTCTWEGKIVGYPTGTNMDPIFLYQRSLFQDPKNQDAFERDYGRPLAPPKDWEEFNELAAFFTRPDENLYGNTLMLGAEAAGDEFYIRWLNMGGGKDGRYSSGGIVDEKYEPIINNDIGVKALQNIVDQYKNKWCAPGATEAMWVDTTSNMFSGGIAMAMGWTSSFYGIDDVKTSKVAGDIEWAQFPLGKDGATIHSTMPAGINRYGKHPEETYKFLMWLFAPEQDRRESLLGNGPIRPSTYKDPDVMKLGLPKTLGQMLNANSVPQPDLPEFGEMNYNFSLEIAKAATGEKSAKKALDDTAANWREILNKAGYYK